MKYVSLPGKQESFCLYLYLNFRLLSFVTAFCTAVMLLQQVKKNLKWSFRFSPSPAQLILMQPCRFILSPGWGITVCSQAQCQVYRGKIIGVEELDQPAQSSDFNLLSKASREIASIIAANQILVQHFGVRVLLSVQCRLFPLLHRCSIASELASAVTNENKKH